MSFLLSFPCGCGSWGHSGSGSAGAHLDSVFLKGFSKPNDSMIRLDAGRVLVQAGGCAFQSGISGLFPWFPVAGVKASPWRKKSELLWAGIIKHYFGIIVAACLVSVAAAGWEGAVAWVCYPWNQPWEEPRALCQNPRHDPSPFPAPKGCLCAGVTPLEGKPEHRAPRGQLQIPRGGRGRSPLSPLV